MSNYKSGKNGTNNIFNWATFAVLVWLPHVGLDFVYTNRQGIFVFPNGNYIFFFISLVGALFLLKSTWHSQVYRFLATRMVCIGVLFLIFGVIVSAATFWNFRVFAIVVLMSAVCIVMAAWAASVERRMVPVVLLIFVSPMLLTCFGALLLDALGPIQLFVLLENHSIMQDATRWQFLHSSSNGFGLDAALALVGLSLLFFHSKGRLLKGLALLSVSGAVICLYYSGTRAAMLFFLMAATAQIFFIPKIDRKHIVTLSIVGLLIMLVAVLLKGQLIEYFRLSGDMAQITSHRSTAYAKYAELIVNDPFWGQGFGAADKTISFHPQNLFYPGIFAELGLIGFLGCMIILGTPAGLILRNRKKLFEALSGNDILLFRFAVSVYFGYAGWLFAEFDILRVSASNQIFFFCWSLVLFVGASLVRTSTHEISLR